MTILSILSISFMIWTIWTFGHCKKSTFFFYVGFNPTAPKP